MLPLRKNPSLMACSILCGCIKEVGFLGQACFTKQCYFLLSPSRFLLFGNIPLHLMQMIFSRTILSSDGNLLKIRKAVPQLSSIEN